MTPDEIYSAVTYELLKRLEEDRRIERKPAGIHANAMGDYFSLWANTVPDGGIIVLGIENDGRITGCSHLSTARLNDLERAGAVYCPDARYECKRIPAANLEGKKDFLLIFRIYYNDSKVVETVSGEAFTRLGESRKRLTADEVRELQIDKGQTDLEQEPSRLAYPEQFDATLIRKFTDAVRYRPSRQPHRRGNSGAQKIG
jgi:ATP-dependent DNA helicase RecG